MVTSSVVLCKIANLGLTKSVDLKKTKIEQSPNLSSNIDLMNGLYYSGMQNRTYLDAISFKGIRDQKTIDTLGFEQFNRQRKKAGIVNQEDIEKNIKPENLLGNGLNSVVYSFSSPLLSDWAIKVDKNPWKDAPNLKKFEKVQDDFAGFNVGQEIAQIGDKSKYHILKKIDGIPHSVNNWSEHINNDSIVNKKEAEDFLSSLKSISSFPQNSFDDFAKQIDLLTQKGYKMDSINPNNLLIDYDKQKIHIIDFFKVADPSHKNSRIDLIAAILDFSLFNSFYDKLDSSNKEDYIKTARTIMQKCNKASEKYPKMPKDEKTYLDYIANVDKWFGFALVEKGGNYNSRYENLKKLIPDIDVF